MKNLEHNNGLPDSHPEYRKSFLISAAAGAAFGFVAALVLIRFIDSPWPPALLTTGITLLAALFSGLAALAAAYLDELLKRWGMQKEKPRRIITYVIPALLTFAVAYTGMFVFGNFAMEPQLQRYVTWGALAGLIFGAIFALIGYRAEKVNQKMRLLEMENRHLAELAGREELLREAARNLAVTEERNRMARELHDSISQGMHGIVYSLRSLRGVLQESRRGLEILGHLEETAEGTLKELRRLVIELSPSPLEEHGLGEALRLHCDLFARRQQVELDLQLDYSGGLQPDQENALYRIVQEALANIQKHAGTCSVAVHLHDAESAVTLTIKDNGCGFDPSAATGGHGLANMSTRACKNDGELQVNSQPGQGATVTAAFRKTPL